MILGRFFITLEPLNDLLLFLFRGNETKTKQKTEVLLRLRTVVLQPPARPSISLGPVPRLSPCPTIRICLRLLELAPATGAPKPYLSRCLPSVWEAQRRDHPAWHCLA